MYQILVYIITPILLLLLFWSFQLMRNWVQVRHIKGTSQFFFLPFRLPILCPNLSFAYWQAFIKATQQYGEEDGTLRVSFMARNAIMITDRDLLKEYFVLKQSSFEKPKFIYSMFEIIGENILSAGTTEQWKRHQRVCAPAFSIDNLQFMSETAVECTDLLRKEWDKKLAHKPSGIPLEGNDFTKITLEVLGRSGFGVSFGMFDTNDTKGHAFCHAIERIISHGMIICRLFEKDSVMYRLAVSVSGVSGALQLANQVMTELIEKRTREVQEAINDPNVMMDTDTKQDRRDILSLLVKANVEEKLLTDMEIKSNALIFTAAGEETTSTTLQWIMYHLSKHVDVQKRAREEISRVLPNGKRPSFDDYHKLEYVTAIIMETLRFNAPIMAAAKQAKKNLTIGKYNIPKGTYVNAFIYGVHRCEKYYTNASVWDPSRWMDVEFRNGAQHDFSYIPFSMGLRKCIGFEFAKFEACMVLVRLLQFYEFTLLNREEEGDVMVEERGVTIRPGNLKVNIVPIVTEQ